MKLFSGVYNSKLPENSVHNTDKCEKEGGALGPLP